MPSSRSIVRPPEGHREDELDWIFVARDERRAAALAGRVVCAPRLRAMNGNSQRAEIFLFSSYPPLL